MPGHSRASGPTVAVITSGTPGPDETDLCRFNIQLRTPTQVTEPAACANREHESDIVVDYLDPGGPTIRHLGPAFTPSPDHDRAGTQSDWRVRPS